MITQKHIDDVESAAKAHGVELTAEQVHAVAGHLVKSGIMVGSFDWTTLLTILMSILQSLLHPPAPTPPVPPAV